MSVVLDSCALAADGSGAERRKKLEGILVDHRAYVCPACVVEALYEIKTTKGRVTVDALMEHYQRGEEIRIVDDRDRDLLLEALALYERGKTLPVCFTAAYANLNDMPVVTSDLGAGDFADLEGEGYCRVWRV